MPQQKVLKIGLSNADKQAMATDIRKLVVAQLFAPYSSSTTYDIGDFCQYDGTIYKCIVAITTAEAWNSDHWAVAKLNEVINAINEAVASVNGKANVDGNYPTMTVGNADQLNSTVFVVDKVPYLYRTSGGDADIGNREYDKIIGGSLVVNQLLKNGNFENVYSWDVANATWSVANNVATFTANARNGRLYNITNNRPMFIKGHKYYIGVSIQLTTGNTSVALYHTIGSGSNSLFTANTTNKQRLEEIFTANSNDVMTTFVFDDRQSDWDAIKVSDYMLIDLTAMFGSTIADYIYSLEQANAGAGVAWFRNYFKEPYYPYNVGAIKNVKLVSHDMVGFNQWDEEWELGTITLNTGTSSDGQNAPSTTQIRSKNYYRVFSNTTYYLKYPSETAMALAMYDENKNFIGYSRSADYGGVGITTTSPNSTYLIPDGVSFIRFYMGSAYGTTYKNDICINLSWSGWRNGQYEPYQKNPYPLDTTIELRGIPKLDSNNNLYFDGDEYSSDGKVVRKYGVSVDLGTIDWELTSAGLNWVPRSYRLTDAKYPVNQQTKPSLICNKYEGEALDTLINHAKTGIGVSGAGWMYLWDDNLPLTMTPEQVKQALSGVYVYFELATTTEETATPFQEPQIVDDFGTEEYVVPTQDGWQVPVGHDTKYPANLRDKLQRLPDMPSVSQNVTETYVVNYNGTTKKCTFVDIAGWLGANGWIKLTDITGYDSTKTQSLKNVNGTLTWVDD